MRKVIFLLLPALSYGKIAIFVNLAVPFVDINGFASNTITDQQREVFKINDHQLKEAIANYTGDKPKDVFVKEESHNLHKTYNWLAIRRNVNAKASNFNRTCETKAWSTKEGFVNQLSEFEDATFLAENVTFIIQNEFDTVKFESNWGNSRLHQHKFPVAFQPGNLTKCEITFNLEYIATLTGDVVVDYNHKRKGHYFWAFDIRNVQRSNGLPAKVARVEKVKIRYGKPLPGSVGDDVRR